MSGVPDSGGLEELTGEDCRTLLRTGVIGRLAVPVAGSAPHVVPVNYVVDGETVVFRTGPGTKLDALRAGPVSFEVDHVDRYREVGWSVLVQGLAYEATAWEVAHLDLRPWAPGEKEHWVRLVPTSVTGRRLPSVDVPLDARGYL